MKMLKFKPLIFTNTSDLLIATPYGFVISIDKTPDNFNNTYRWAVIQDLSNREKGFRKAGEAISIEQAKKEVAKVWHEYLMNFLEEIFD